MTDWAGFVCSRQHGCRPVHVPRTQPLGVEAVSAKAKRAWTVARQTKYLVKFISSAGSNSRYDGAIMEYHDGSSAVIEKADGARFLALPDDEKYRLVRGVVLALRDRAGATTPLAQVLLDMLRGLDSLPPIPMDLPLLDLTGEPAVLPPGRIA